MYYSSIYDKYNKSKLSAKDIVNDIIYYGFDKQPLEVYFRDKEGKQLIPISEIEINYDSDGKAIVAFVADKKNNYNVSKVKTE